RWSAAARAGSTCAVRAGSRRCRSRSGPNPSAASSAPRTGAPGCAAPRSSWRSVMDEPGGGAVDLVISGEAMRLFAGRALYWPARSRLLIADLHLGKGDILRASGIPVPSGGTGLDLARLGALLELTHAAQLWVLGDFLHGARQPRVE